jgi:branched-chain amino acid transport system substrate-binding protein
MTTVLACALAQAMAAACTTEAPRPLHVGDAVPRANQDSSIIQVVAAMLDSAHAPPLPLIPWTAASGGALATESEQAQRFVSDSSVVAVVGHAGSKLTLIAAPTYRAADMPLVVPTATARALREAGPNIFMLAPSDEAIGAFMVDRAVDSLGLRRLSVMHVADAYGEGIRAGLAARAAARGISLVGETALTGWECEPNETSAAAITRAFLRRVQPDALLLALPQRLAECVIRAAVAQDSSIVILASDSFSPPPRGLALDAHQSRAVHHVVFWEPGTDALNRRFDATFRQVVGRAPDASQALTADALLLLAAALRDGMRTRAEVGDWLRRVGTDGHPPFAGITGPIDFTRPRTAGLRLKPLRPGTELP